MTNYECIKSMSVEEMVELLNNIQTDALFAEGNEYSLKYPVDWGKWLNSEVEE